MSPIADGEKYKTYRFFDSNGRKLVTVRAKGYKEAWTPKSKRREPSTGYRRTAIGFQPPEARK